MFEGAILDVDGVLVASPHERAWRETLERLLATEWANIAPQTSFLPGGFMRTPGRLPKAHSLPDRMPPHRSWSYTYCCAGSRGCWAPRRTGTRARTLFET